MKFSELLDEYLELRERGPIADYGHKDKTFYTRMDELREMMDTLIENNFEQSKKGSEQS